MNNEQHRRLYDELRFWIWATLSNADAYIVTANNANAEFEALFSFDDHVSRIDNRAYLDAQKHEELARYHLTSSIGVLVRVSKHARKTFPEMARSIDAAKHLLQEGVELRNMVEHAPGKDGYNHGGGKQREKFVRTSNSISADATSTIQTGDDILLGNRLSLRTTICEVKAIEQAAVELGRTKGIDSRW